jgi:6-pyruvoyltetrahydropterin/6-carboxytetrahydropterin synthase
MNERVREYIDIMYDVMRVAGSRTVHAEAVFEGAHWLKEYAGKCSRLHGHTWLLEVEVELDAVEAQRVIEENNGMMWDFTNIKKVVEKFDHTCLNEGMEKQPTAENISEEIYKILRPSFLFDVGIVTVRLYETAVRKEAYVEFTKVHVNEEIE